MAKKQKLIEKVDFYFIKGTFNEIYLNKWIAESENTVAKTILLEHYGLNGLKEHTINQIADKRGSTENYIIKMEKKEIKSIVNWFTKLS